MGGGGLPMCVAPVATSQSSSNHEHVLTISAAQINAGSSTYMVSTVDGHSHTITLNSADFVVLRAGGSVMKLSTLGGGHRHTYTIECA
jgi:hypothetical protein